MVPNDMCSGSCQGKIENCPSPMVCGLANPEAESEIIKAIVFMLSMVGLIVFCFLVLIWL
jgi:hypothetical protein